MSSPNDADIPPKWQMVPFREYPEPLDLFGRDLISLLGHSKEDVAQLVGPIAARSEMQSEELPGEYVTTMTGEVADEVHEWPNATLGSEFRQLMLQFREGRLVNIRWKSGAAALQRSSKPWWRFWR
jgi:hypothetical protein